MRLGPRELVLSPGKNRPLLDGRVRPAHEHVAAITGGFRATWRFLAARRDELLARIETLAGAEVRFFARATQRYVLILQGALAPASLDDGGGLLAPLLDSERRDLAQGDVPVFLARPGGRELYDARGRCVDGFFVEPSLDECARRIAALDDLGGERHAAFVARVLREDA